MSSSSINLMQNICLEASNLGKSYGEAIILDQTNLTVRSGTSVAFVSPSGSGKSTLLSMLGLLLKPTTGDILIDGVGTVDLGDKALSQKRLRTFGFVFQHTHLIGSLRAIENVAIPAHLEKNKRIDTASTARALLERFGLENRLYHYPHQLSTGQKRRVAVARALMLNPPVLIADEPTNDLDKDSAERVSTALFEHVESGGILLFATHDESLAARADRIMHLEGTSFV